MEMVCSKIFFHNFNFILQIDISPWLRLEVTRVIGVIIEFVIREWKMSGVDILVSVGIVDSRCITFFNFQVRCYILFIIIFTSFITQLILP